VPPGIYSTRRGRGLPEELFKALVISQDFVAAASLLEKQSRYMSRVSRFDLPERDSNRVHRGTR
jgi:hypothetical protein